ncbi:hypothetical protein FF1_028678 [Malus domestica]
MATLNPSLDILNNNVGKCLDGKDIEKLDKYLRRTSSSEPLWEGDMAAVFKQNVEFLLKELGLRTCAIDAFSKILSIRQSLDPTRKMKSLFMPTHCWHKTVTEFLKRNQANERSALTTGVVEKVVKRRGKTIIVREPLKKGEKETYNFLSHAGTEVDCAVAIMYYMQHLAEGWPLKGIFEKGELTMMRAKIISMMLNAPGGRGRK